MVRTLLLVAILTGLCMGFVGSGGMDTVFEAEKSSQHNERIKDFIALGNRVLDGDSLSRLDLKYTSLAHEIAEIPPEWRQKNWSQGGGSCVHATTITLLKWQGMYEIAAEWRKEFGGGEATAQKPHTDKFDQFGLKYVVTNDGDEDFIRWALLTRRGVGVSAHAGHCLTWIGDEIRSGREEILELDNNDTNHPFWRPWDEAISEWKNKGGGHGFTFTNGHIPPPRPVYVPAKASRFPKPTSKVTYTLDYKTLSL